MGFYDSETGSTKKRLSTISVAVISAIIGGLLTSVLSSIIMNNSMLPSQYQSTLDLSGPTKTTSVKVNSKITEAVSNVKPAVVGIINLREIEDPFLPNQETQKGTGSGVIFDRGNGKARIVTNYHVIEGHNQIKVVLPEDGNKSTTVEAKVLGSDAITDLAVLEISDENVKAIATFGNSDTLQAGEPAIAIGNPLGLEETVTVGVISSPKRTIEVADYLKTDVIQTDAAINPGNSGGALINAAGQVIGINRLKISEKGVEGLGFAIPANDARPIINSLIRYGNVPRAFLGINFRDLNEYTQHVWEILKLPANIKGGIVVLSADAGTPASNAGLRKKDVIVALDDHNVINSSELRRYLYEKKKVGDKIKITIYRNGKKQTLTATLGKAPTTK